jgi:GT2 family glycosyltransferase
MLIGITVTKNDYSRLKAWASYYQCYREALDEHVIVLDGCAEDYASAVEKSFSDSTILYNRESLGLVVSYNKAIRYALEKGSEYISLIANDMEIDTLSYRKLLNHIQGRIVGSIPVMLDINGFVEDAGPRVLPNLFMTSSNRGEKFVSSDKIVMCESVTGGMNVMHRSYYEICGLQDEKLFMYSDEIDTYFKLKKFGLHVVVDKSLVAYHNHVSMEPGRHRESYSDYLMFRNKMYLARKYTFLFIPIFFRLLYAALVMYKSDKNIATFFVRIKGILRGLIY